MGESFNDFIAAYGVFIQTGLLLVGFATVVIAYCRANSASKSEVASRETERRVQCALDQANRIRQKSVAAMDELVVASKQHADASKAVVKIMQAQIVFGAKWALDAVLTELEINQLVLAGESPECLLRLEAKKHLISARPVMSDTLYKMIEALYADLLAYKVAKAASVGEAAQETEVKRLRAIATKAVLNVFVEIDSLAQQTGEAADGAGAGGVGGE